MHIQFNGTARFKMNMRRFCLFLIAICCQEVFSCDNGWETYNGHCYFFGDSRVSWASASAICKSYNAHLAIIDNAHENNFLQQEAIKFTSGHTEDIRYWLDGSDSVLEGEWIWTETGQALSYTDWYPGEPNDNVYEGGADCLVLYSPMAFRWDDRPCLSNHKFICEKRSDALIKLIDDAVDPAQSLLDEV